MCELIIHNGTKFMEINLMVFFSGLFLMYFLLLMEERTLMFYTYPHLSASKYIVMNLILYIYHNASYGCRLKAEPM